MNLTFPGAAEVSAQHQVNAVENLQLCPAPQLLQEDGGLPVQITISCVHSGY